MKKIIVSLVIILAFGLNLQAQSAMKDKMVKTVKLEQTPGEFTQTDLVLEAGTYVFEISNNNVGHQVGFVLAPKSNPDAHIKSAYVTKAVDNNSTESSKATTLEKGEYVYFCPLNPTPKYTLTVK